VRDDDAGLMAAMRDLDSPDFAAADLAPQMRDFCERTSRWRLEVWSQWGAVAWPFGWMISVVRPTAGATEPAAAAARCRAGDGRPGRTVDEADGRRLGGAWLRAVRSTGQQV